jgi:hypothetical protein
VSLIRVCLAFQGPSLTRQPRLSLWSHHRCRLPHLVLPLLRPLLLLLHLIPASARPARHPQPLRCPPSLPHQCKVFRLDKDCDPPSTAFGGIRGKDRVDAGDEGCGKGETEARGRGHQGGCHGRLGQAQEGGRARNENDVLGRTRVLAGEFFFGVSEGRCLVLYWTNRLTCGSSQMTSPRRISVSSLHPQDRSPAHGTPEGSSPARPCPTIPCRRTSSPMEW